MNVGTTDYGCGVYRRLHKIPPPPGPVSKLEYAAKTTAVRQWRRWNHLVERFSIKFISLDFCVLVVVE